MSFPLLLKRTNVITDMTNQYSSSKICPYKQPGCKEEEKLYLEPGENNSTF